MFNNFHQQKELISRFPNVSFGRFQVWQLSPHEIDEMLRSGWFRTDRHVVTSFGRYVDNQWKPVVMLRVVVKDYKWKKSLRKILRRNCSQFEVRIRPFVPRNEVEDLWQSFKRMIHKWNVVPNLANHLFKGIDTSSFQTYEVGVYDRGKLIAFSLFDRGHTSIASLEAAYDFGYRKFSLGLFTMLMELQYCIENELDHYYPGFYAKNSSMFQYKLRPGNVEFYHYLQGTWRPWNELKPEDWILEGLFDNLKKVDFKLKEMGFQSAVKAFKKLNLPRYEFALSNYEFLVVGESEKEGLDKLFIQVAWDPYHNKFVLFANRSLYAENQTTSDSFVPFQLMGVYTDLSELKSGIENLRGKSTDSNP
ncbi:MAG: hypothetical protein AAFZ15_03665 [Bacteroidota bacterium]